MVKALLHSKIAAINGLNTAFGVWESAVRLKYKGLAGKNE
jgi:hypothetical protein